MISESGTLRSKWTSWVATTTVVVATHDVHLLKKVPESLIMRLDRGRLSDPTGALRYPPRRHAAGP